jgi:prevent-host-death family protein
MEVSVKETRKNFSSLLDKTEKGEEILITRRGKRIAKIVPLKNTSKHLPDLSQFRASISVKSEGLSNAVCQNRDEERY